MFLLQAVPDYDLPGNHPRNKIPGYSGSCFKRIRPFECISDP